MRFSENECSSAQIKEKKDLRAYAKVMESSGDIHAAEQSYIVALQVDLFDVKTLACFAAFLHTKKGELDRAEAFFARALQVCVPSLLYSISSASKRKTLSLPSIGTIAGHRWSKGLNFSKFGARKIEGEDEKEQSEGDADANKIIFTKTRSFVECKEEQVVSDDKGGGLERYEEFDCRQRQGQEDYSREEHKFSSFDDKFPTDPSTLAVMYNRNDDDCTVSTSDSYSMPISPAVTVDTDNANPIHEFPILGIGGSKIRTKDVTYLLLKFAAFLIRGRVDVSGAAEVYSKAVEIDPDNSTVLASAAHFFGANGPDRSEALDLFARCMKADPHNALHALWYAKLLTKCGKLTQAEVMFQAALQQAKKSAVCDPARSGIHTATVDAATAHAAPLSFVPQITTRARNDNSDNNNNNNNNNNNRNSSDNSVEASVICNYAIFTYKHKHNIQKSVDLFESGLRNFKGHKGLIGNYRHMLKENPTLLVDRETLALLCSAKVQRSLIKIKN